MEKKRKFNSLNELLDEVDNWINLLQDKKAILTKLIDQKQGSIINKPDKRFYSYSLSIDKKDYDKLEKAAKKEGMSISKFIKEKYWENFMSGGPNSFNTQRDFMDKEIADRPKANANKSIAMALNPQEEERFNKRLADWNIDPSMKREIMKFFISQFLYGSYNLRNNLKWCKCESSNLSSYAYDAKTRELYVKFHEDAVYVYYDVPKSIYDGLTKAKSKGQYHSEYIINSFKFKRIK